MKHFIATAALIAFAAAPLASFAGQDEAKRQITQRLHEQKQKLAAAEKAQGAERDKLMQEHMNDDARNDGQDTVNEATRRHDSAGTEGVDGRTSEAHAADDGPDDDRASHNDAASLSAKSRFGVPLFMVQ